MPKKTRVFEASKNDDEPIMFLNSKPLNMFVPIDNPTRRTKSTSTMKKSSKKVSKIGKKPYVRAHNTVNLWLSMRGLCQISLGKILVLLKPILGTSCEPRVESHANSQV